MMEMFQLCPGLDAPRVPWDLIHERYEWIRALKGCPQSPRYHAEGDVWVHTRMVCEALVALESWQALPGDLRQDLFAAALLHDAAKPECTKVQADGRITSRGHARRGAQLARRLLWLDRVPADRRERICALVRHHMMPLYLRDSDRRERQVLTVSQSLRCDLLGLLGRADAEGRICDDPEDLTLRHRAFEEICRSLDCFDSPYEFSSAATRFHYFHQMIEDPEVPVPEGGPEVVLMSGLPGAGKRDWAARELPERTVIDIDDLRAGHGVTWRDNQGAVISEARDRARRLLSRGEPFVWIDMNLGRQLRDHLVHLFAEHGARVRIVFLEAEPEAVEARLREDPAAQEGDLQALLDYWETPEEAEAHHMEHVDPRAAVADTVSSSGAVDSSGTGSQAAEADPRREAREEVPGRLPTPLDQPVGAVSG